MNSLRGSAQKDLVRWPSSSGPPLEAPDWQGDIRARLSKTQGREHQKVAALFAQAGIEIGGHNPWDLQVHDPRFYGRLLAGGSLAAGESFMDGWWEAPALDQLCCRVHGAALSDKINDWTTIGLALKSRLFNRQNQTDAPVAAEEHYNLGNDLYQAMLGRWMQYTCAYWRNAESLDQAQENKLDLICRKLKLKPGMTVLDVGGGFGTLAQFIASNYGCHVVVYNISSEQVAYGRELCQGLPVRFEQRDYREAIVEPAFDRIVSVGFFEHVGHKNYQAFLTLMDQLLKPGGLFLLHTIGGNISRTTTDAWLDKHIFANGVIPSMAQLGVALEKGAREPGRWVVEDWHNFGPDYDRTLLAWWHNFDGAWPTLQRKYGDRFYRMWKYYLLGCAGGFRARKLQLWQMILSRGDVERYEAVR